MNALARTLASGGLLLLAAASSAGCSAFEDYNAETRKARQDFARGEADAALDRLKGGVDNELDGLCYSLERGVIAQAGGEFKLSQGEFERAEKQIEHFEDRGATPAGAAEYAGSILVNDKTIPYEGEAFERILIPVFNCRNYLLQGNQEDAMVEIRKVWFQQEQARREFQKDMDAAKSKSEENSVDTAQLPGVQSQVTYPPGSLQSPESIYEITYAHYMSALLAERSGLMDDARIGMEAAAKIRPDVGFIRQDLARVKQLSLGGAPDPGVKLPPPDSGSVALLFDCGWAPHKKEFKVVFPTYHSLGAIAIPIYERTENPASRARLVLGDRTFQTVVLTDVDAIVFKYHKKKLPLIILRQAIRLAVKVAAGEATAQGVKAAVNSGNKKNNGEAEVAGWLAGLAVGVYNIASEQADLRAWLTLPQSFQATRAFVPPGDYPARVELLGSGGGVLNVVDLGTVHVEKGKLSILVARSVGTNLYAAREGSHR
jgi:hypothetical protein